MTAPDITPMDVDKTWIPGAYPNPPPPQLLLISTPNTPTPVDPTTWPCQTRKQPVQFQDILPVPPLPAPPKPQLPTVYLLVTNPLTTTANAFGLFRKYLFYPSYDPDSIVDPGDLSNLSASVPPPPPPSPGHIEEDHKPPGLFSNMSIWRLMWWMNTGSQSKSEGEVNQLVNGVLNTPDFHAKDLYNFSAH